jgi:hypothetical protein
VHQGVGLNPFRAIAQMLLAFWTTARRASLQIASADLMMTVAIAASSSFALCRNMTTRLTNVHIEEKQDVLPHEN